MNSEEQQKIGNCAIIPEESNRCRAEIFLSKGGTVCLEYVDSTSMKFHDKILKKWGDLTDIFSGNKNTGAKTLYTADTQ